MTRYFFLIILLVLAVIPAYAYNSGFQPIYQPPSLVGGSGPNELYCTAGMWFYAYNSTTKNFDCTTVPAGNVYENNTMSSPTHANTLVLTKSGVDLPVKGIACGGDIVCSANTTDVTVSFTDVGGSSALDDLTDVIITSPAYLSTLFYNGVDWIDKIFSINTLSPANDFFVTGINNQTGTITTNQFSVNTITCGGTDKISAINNVTGTVTCTTDTSGGGSNALLDGSVHTDTTAQTVSRGSLITGQGGSPTWNELVIGGSGTFLKSDGTDISWGAGDGAGAVTLGADVTCALTAAYCTVWTIPLTASSGNRIDVNMIGDSNTAGGSIQMRVQFDNAGNTGYCTYRTYTGAAAETLDVLAATAATDTGETAWLAAANVPMPLDIHCGFETDASPGNALVQVQNEVASTITIQKGSNYIKTP